MLSVLMVWGAGGCSNPSPTPNLREVSPTVLRGGRPTDEGFRHLRERYAVDTVIDLDAKDGDASERAVVESLGMAYVPARLQAAALDPATVRQALAALTSTKGRVFVHCHAGMDRTGAVVAAYRVLHEKWTSAAALREMRRYQHPLHALAFPNLPEYVRSLDRAEIHE